MKEHTCPACGRRFVDPKREKETHKSKWEKTILNAREDLRAIRNLTALSWRELDGETYREIGRRLGVGIWRATQLQKQGLRQIARFVLDLKQQELVPKRSTILKFQTHGFE